ncbi:MAG: response regulator transcription factor [Bacteroidia bacterium]|nr:response regulator transcription factor [Bacteroidia bacterium]
MESDYIIKVAIAEDHDLMREGLIKLIQKNKRLKVVIAAANGAELLNSMVITPVDVVVSDIDMPIMNGKEALIEIGKLYKNVKVIMLSMYFQDSYVEEFTILGAKGFLPKNITSKILNDAIMMVYEKGHYFHEETSKLLLARLMNEKKLVPYVHAFDLTEQERSVLKLICEEKNSAEIADALCLSKRTIENMRAELLDKTNSKNLAGLVIYALRYKIVDISNFEKKKF